MLEQGLASEPAEPILQPKRATYEGEADEEKPLQTKAESSFPSAQSSPGCSSAPSSVHAALNAPGQPLAAGTRAFFEPRFGHDFSVVRVHADSRAAASARAFNALAYTTGQHVVFAEGNFSPQTMKGKRLLAHELAHVVQQTSQASTPHLQRAPDDEPKPRRDVAIVGEGWEGAEELGKVLAGGGEVHSVTSLDQAVEVLKAINYPVGTLYFITHSTARGDLQFGINEKMIDVDRIGGKFKGLIPADNAPQTVDFRGCSVGSDPKAMEKIARPSGRNPSSAAPALRSLHTPRRSKFRKARPSPNRPTSSGRTIRRRLFVIEEIIRGPFQAHGQKTWRRGTVHCE